MGRISCACAAAAALLVCGGARADVSLHATLGNLAAEVVDLDPADGGAPAVTWQPRSPEALGFWQRGYITLSTHHGDDAFEDATFDTGPTLELGVQPPDGTGATGRLTGRGAADGGLLDVAVHVVAAPDALRHAEVDVYADQVPFVLAPHTELVLRAAGTASARADDGAREAFNNEVDLNVRLLDTYGGVVDGAYDVAWNASPRDWHEGSYVLDNPFALGTRIANRSADPMAGYVQLSTWAWASNTPPPVPEPASAALLAAGLAWMAWRGRTRTG